jgi:plastocyanin
MPATPGLFEKLKRQLPVKNRPVVALGLIILAIVILLLLLLSLSAAPKPKPQPKYPVLPTPTPYVQAVWTVIATREIFVPKVTTMKLGRSVSFINLAGSPIDIVASSSSSLSYQKLNIGQIVNGQSAMSKFTSKGTYVFFNKLYPKAVGTIIVK